MTSAWPYNAAGGQQEIAIENSNEILASTSGLEKLPGGVIVAHSLEREIRVGEILARLSAAVTGLGEIGQVVPRKSTEAAAVAAIGTQFVIVDDAHPFVVGDTLKFGGTAADEVISAINYTTGRIDLATTLSAEVGLNERVYVDTAGMKDAVGIAAERFTPVSGAAGIAHGRVSMYIGGLFKLAKLHGGGAGGLDTAAITDLGAVMITAGEGTLARIRVGS